MLATVFAPMVVNAGGPQVVAREYVPYAASFGGATPGSAFSYADSVAGGLAQLRTMAKAVTDRCERTRLALVGYSQGAHVVSLYAKEIGHGQGNVPSEKVAAVALFSDPTRRPGSPLFPGAASKVLPDPAPGLDAAELSGLPRLQQPMPSGGGIGPKRDIEASFGDLTGRVASFCVTGDLACDAPPEIPILHAITNIVGQALLTPTRPFTVLQSVLHATETTLVKTTQAVIGEDLHGNEFGDLSLTAELPLSKRLVEASDPRVRVDGPNARAALVKLATLTLNAMTAVAGTVLTTDDVAEVMATAQADPIAGLTRLATKLLQPQDNLPVSGDERSDLLTAVFDALGAAIADNHELVDPAVWARYQDTVARHGAYAFVPLSAEQTSTAWVANWFAELAKALAAGKAVTGPTSSPRPEGSSMRAAPPAPVQSSTLAPTPAKPPVRMLEGRPRSVPEERVVDSPSVTSLLTRLLAFETRLTGDDSPGRWAGAGWELLLLLMIIGLLPSWLGSRKENFLSGAQRERPRSPHNPRPHEKKRNTQ
ncbi:cutinase family protein [Nocardia goodfellowii]|uniref:Cutinase n=1 Tax=Nocardia goodfellowii TaxID=882446 RepID=A0ABS4QRK1_9NOCA|nr:cutinase family protein [Nocardia goodfellowii]MBP2194325.1 hypothetical protein [Nocardia goodfellowii]